MTLCYAMKMMIEFPSLPVTACHTVRYLTRQMASKQRSWSLPGADPEILHGRWLMGWLSIVNYTGVRGWLVNNGGRLLYYIA